MNMTAFFARLRYYFAVLTDRRTPLTVKLLLGLGLVYLLYPFDLIFDQIPVLGWLDDLTIGSFLVALALRLVPQEVKDRVAGKTRGQQDSPP